MLHAWGTNNSATLHAPGLKIIINIICNIAPSMLHAWGTNNSAMLHASGLIMPSNVSNYMRMRMIGYMIG